MEDKVDKKFCVATYESYGGIKIHSYVSFEDLDDLKVQLKAEGYTAVGLVKFGWFDESENCIRSGIRIENIQLEHVAWCIEETTEFRYLALYRD